MKLRDNITTKDIECNCGCGFNKVSPAILDVAQELRTHYGKPIHINSRNHSGCRCYEHNTSVGGTPKSKHMPDEITGVCRALDFDIEQVSNKAVYDYLCAKYPNCLGIGLYSWGIHIDDRMDRAYRWNNTI